MRTVVVQTRIESHLSDSRFEVRERDENGAILGIFTTVHDAVAYQQAYTNGRW